MSMFFGKKTVVAVSVFILFCAAVLLCAARGVGEESPTTHFCIPASAYDRTDNRVLIDQYRDGGPVHLAGGTFVEYDIPFPAAGRYRLNIERAMADIRPLTVWLDNEKIGRLAENAPTPTWNSIDAVWDVPVEFDVLDAGIHTLAMRADGLFPHVVQLDLFTDEPSAVGTSILRPNAHRLIEPQPAAIPDPAAMERGIRYLIETYGEEYPHGEQFLAELLPLAEVRRNIASACGPLPPDAPEFAENNSQLVRLRKRALFEENPVIDFDRLLVIRRSTPGVNGLSPSWESNSTRVRGLPMNWESNSSLPKSGYNDEIMLLDINDSDAPLVSLYKPPRDTLVSDLDLDFDAERLMFSAVGAEGNWQIFEATWGGEAMLTAEATADGDGSLRANAVSILGVGKDFDFYDSCYLPDGRIIATSTAPMVGVPCVYGSSHVANNFLFDRKKNTLRQLGFDQEHNWCPTVLPNGRVLYSRWEYADIPHSNSRFLFSMNPDGSTQSEFYGSNSFWPNSIFFARPIPGSPTQVVAVIGGHHDHPRMGELVVLDPALGRHEADGAVCRIPGWGEKVEPVVADGLTRNSWPKFLHPYPLEENFFLVSASDFGDKQFGIYLVDTFDNMILIKSLPDDSLMEPIPLKKTERPPIIPDRVNLADKNGYVFMSDVYSGPGLKGIPKGVVQSLRVYTYHFGYHVNGGLLGTLGADGPWDIRAVLGTVPVNEDGSAFFKVPANLPIAIQPLDAAGESLALMRSWMTAMPGETLQCTGCHEPQNRAPPIAPASTAFSQKPHDITPFEPEIRGFAFSRTVQPILDRYCLSCHDGSTTYTDEAGIVRDLISLRGDRLISDWSSQIGGSIWMPGIGGRWTPGYDNLARFVRRSGIESDIHLLAPMEYAADTTELVQILRGDHYGVTLDAASWEKLVTWIDMNTPFHGSWSDITGSDALVGQSDRRTELLELYGGVGIDFENRSVKQGLRDDDSSHGWTPLSETAPNNAPSDALSPQQRVDEAIARKNAAQQAQIAERLAQQNALISAEAPNATDPILPPVLPRKTFSLKGAGEIEFVRIPAEKPFWMATREVTNRQIRAFDPDHDSGRESLHGYQFGQRGYDRNRDEMPAVHVSQNKANDFCRWLAAEWGEAVTLPSESEWEFATRAGTVTPFWYGDFTTDFSPFANLGDRRLSELAVCTAVGNYTQIHILENPNHYDDWVPKESRFDDGNLLPTQPGDYAPNRFGLYDMHGNVAEWTRSRFDATEDDPWASRVVKGGSWYDRPYRATWYFRRGYPPYQGAFDVGVRLVIEESR